MRPISTKPDNRIELFRERLDNMLNRRHELYLLTGVMIGSVWSKSLASFIMLKQDAQNERDTIIFALFLPFRAVDKKRYCILDSETYWL